MTVDRMTAYKMIVYERIVDRKTTTQNDCI